MKKEIKDIKKGIILASVLMLILIVSGVIIRQQIYSLSNELQIQVDDFMVIADYILYFSILLGIFVIVFLCYCWYVEKHKKPEVLE